MFHTYPTTLATGQTPDPKRAEHRARRRRRRLWLPTRPRHRAPVAPSTEETSYVGRRRAEGDAR